jgi:HEAT repeat protein
MYGDDGDFKKGKAKPIAALVVVLAVVGVGGALLSVGVDKDAENLAPDLAAVEKKRVLVLPEQEQITLWRKYAAATTSSYLKEEALKRLAWANDPTGIDLAIAALQDPLQKIRSQAALALVEYGSAAEKAKPALLQALKEAGPESKPQIAWALVTLKESSAFSEIMALYRSGALSKVQRLGGGLAFDPEKLVALISLDQLASMHKDESPSVRQLVATVLSRQADAKYTDQLVSLVKDTDKSVAHQAAPGLGKIGDAKAREPLVEALRGLKAEERLEYLEALRNGIGASGLVLALETVSTDTKTREWHQTEQIFKMIDELQDPSGADALVAYLEKNNHPHWQFRVGQALASVGDLRAVPILARRLRQDEMKIYGDETDYEQLLKRDNKERVISARMLSDLAVIHPDKLDVIREQSEQAVWGWITALPMPHANGLRALSAMGSKVHLAKLQKWADPKEALPLEGQQPPMPDAWVIAQSALRYLGRMKDSWGTLEKQLTRRDPKLDITQDALNGGGIAILGMSLRALGFGAADGMSEWGDNRGVKPLMKFIEEPKEHEEARHEACMALAWVSTDEDMVNIAKKIQEYGGSDPKQQTIRQCYLETLVQRPIPGTAGALLPLLKSDLELSLRHQIARAIGKAGVSGDVETKLQELLKDESLMLDAGLALMLGGTQDVAARSLAALADAPPEALSELQEMWYKSFGYWSNSDLEQGHVFRFVDNAVAMSRVEIKDAPQAWARVQLTRQFDNLMFDNGPHSFTRVVLRAKLMQMATGDNATKRASAIRTLKFMKEQGALLALRDAPGEAGTLAKAAYHELMNPAIVAGVRTIEEEGKN